MSDDSTEARLQVALEEIERLKVRMDEVQEASIADYEANTKRLQDSVGATDVLLARIAELEQFLTIARGSWPTSPGPDEPAKITHHVPPSASPHNE